MNMVMARMLTILLMICTITPNRSGSAAPNTSESTAPNTSRSTVLSTSESTAPNTSVSIFPNTSESTVPNTSESTVPNTSESTAPNTSVSTTPNTSQSTVPNASESTVPNENGSTVPNTSESTVPNTSQSTVPNTSVSPTPNTSESTTPNTSVSTVPNTSESTVPNTGESTAPNTSVSTTPNTSVSIIQEEFPTHLITIIVPSLGGAVFIVILITVVILRMRKNRKNNPFTEINFQMKWHTKQSPGKSEARYKNASGGLYENFTPGDIPITEFKTFVLQKIKLASFEEEYMVLPSGLQAKHDAGKLTVNKHKNRFRGIFAYDDSRVRLVRNNTSDTDYINASYITGYNGNEKAYIAAQGPNEHTVGDFWWMIWQEDVSCVVMLTNIVEKNRTKCEKYWPEGDERVRYGELEIWSVSTTQYTSSVSRKLEIHNTKNNLTRYVTQFHFVRWPDHGVPSAASLVKFWKQIKHAMFSHRPLLIHCSAGIGRTGTFIALDILMDRCRSENTLNVFNCVQRIRQERIDAVQTKSQYVFLHKVLLEALYSTETSLQDTDLTSWIQEGRELIQREFQNILELQDLTAASVVIDSDREGEGESPLYVPKLSHPEFFVVLGFTPNTAEDFWARIESHNVKVVVTICSDGHFNLLTGAAGAPAVRNSSYITIISSSDITDHLTEVRITVESSTNAYENTDPREVTVYGITPPLTASTLDVVALMELLESLSLATGENIMMYSGPDRSAAMLLCAASIIISTLQQHHRVDVFLTVREMQCLLPSFTISQEEYWFLYEVAQVYQKTQNVYVNM